jgi:hypothetical protein
MAHRIESLARRVEDDPYFLAHPLASYAQSEGLSDYDLAKRLGCEVDQLSRIRLCRRPRSEPALFQDDIASVATAFNISQDILLQAVRRADALTAFRVAAVRDAGLLMAARDREDDGSPGSEFKGESP